MTKKERFRNRAFALSVLLCPSEVPNLLINLIGDRVHVFRVWVWVLRVCATCVLRVCYVCVYVCYVCVTCVSRVSRRVNEDFIIIVVCVCVLRVCTTCVYCVCVTCVC